MVTVATLTRPLAGQTECGDAGRCWMDGSRMILALADGLGHGPEAATAARAALDHLQANVGADIPRLFKDCNHAIGHTRGVALGLAWRATITVAGQRQLG